MPINKEVLDLARDKNFSEFSLAIKKELKQKLSNHKLSKQYASDYDKIQQMKQSFANISQIKDSNKETETED